jgi:site-specific DNA recombinase
MKRAAIYARVSSERQAGDDRVSIDAQLADCRDLCAQRGYQIVGEYVDKENYRARGKLVRPSGARKDRPAYKAMLQAAQAGDVDVIVAWKEDRLYRGMYAAMPFSEVLDERGAALDVGLVLETFDRKMLAIKAAMGKIELDNIRERMIMGRRVRLERGEVPGGDQVKYGYRKVDKRLAIHEKEAEIVRKVFAWYIGGESIQNMRKRLDATGIAPRRGKRWSKATVQKIIAGEFYATGEIITTLDGVDYPIPCPPIITPETWQQSLEIRERNIEYYKPRNLKEDYLCAGLVYCNCGWKMRATTHGMSRQGRRPNKEGTLTGSYVCQRQHTAPETVTEECAKSAGAQSVDDYVWRYVRRICKNPALVRDAMARRLESLQAEQEGIEDEIERLERSGRWPASWKSAIG